jgi:hypothetical protein
MAVPLKDYFVTMISLTYKTGFLIVQSEIGTGFVHYLFLIPKP